MFFLGNGQLCKQTFTYNLQFYIDKIGKNYYINGIEIREVTNGNKNISRNRIYQHDCGS